MKDPLIIFGAVLVWAGAVALIVAFVHGCQLYWRAAKPGQTPGQLTPEFDPPQPAYVDE